jgi:hypothetical protein
VVLDPGGSRVYVADGTGGFRIFGVWPILQGQIGQLSGNFTDVAVRGNKAYLIENGSTPGLRVVDITNPAAPVAGQVVSMERVTIQGDFAYVVNTVESGHQRIRVYDVSGPVIGTPDETVRSGESPRPASSPS